MTQEPIPGASGEQQASKTQTPHKPTRSGTGTLPRRALLGGGLKDLAERVKAHSTAVSDATQDTTEADPQSEKKHPHKITRKQMLVLLGLTGAAAYGLVRRDDISGFLDQIQGAATGNLYDLDQIESDVPPSLEGKAIPKENKLRRDADKIFQEGLDLAFLPSLHYAKPANYLDLGTAANMLSQDINLQDLKQNGAQGILDAANAVTYQIDIPYSSYFSGSGSNIKTVEDIIVHDPGTGIVKAIRDAMREKDPTFDVWTACSKDQYVHDVLTQEQRTFITRQIQDWYSKAMTYVQGERNKKGGQISTSVLFAYFLRQNNGDILASAWDTATWLKILVRNDPDKGFAFDPTYARARQATDLFRDEFSPKISANWVVDNVSSHDTVLNDVSDPYIYPQYKDYMPPNRAGGFYHAWNIMALSLCMDEPLVTRMIATHLNPVAEKNGKRFTEYGREKSKADMAVVGKAGAIETIVKQYEK